MTAKTNNNKAGFAPKQAVARPVVENLEPVRLCCYVQPSLRRELKNIANNSDLQLQHVVEWLLGDALAELQAQPTGDKASRMIADLTNAKLLAERNKKGKG